ncbi:phosphomevalonate kinase [Virgibacillus sp. W0430]|uniref:phosphomevalonate kinase n=1 Tax=Virgibacillus sp. W0430 TaxID=3391580 RepID=UPI003F48310B
MLSQRSITVKVPGKLMVAGEFAVLEPHHQLVVTAVNRFVYATIDANSDNQLTLENFGINQVSWSYQYNALEIRSNDERIRFVAAALQTVLDYLYESNIKPESFSLSIKSELDDATGVKYGLGSSAAVVTAVVSAVLNKYLPAPPPEQLVFKLAAIAHVKTQGNGSGADIAASAYGGLLQYASFQAEWLIAQYKQASSVQSLVNKEWTYFSIKRLQLPSTIRMCIGWTGKPASTAKLVNRILQLKKTDKASYERFLHSSETAVNMFLNGIIENNIPLFMEGIHKNRLALAAVGDAAQVAIETNQLKKLSELAAQHGGAGKLSGAGGGDCGIAFVASSQASNALMHAWEQFGIRPLALKPYPKGAQII